VTAAGQSIHSADDLAAALRAAAGTIDLNVLRGTDERSIRVGLGQPEGSA
jgi:hypothetical protein